MEVKNSLDNTFVTGTVEETSKITGGINTMKENNITFANATIDTASAKLKRAVYSEKLTKAIIKRIKEGATSYDIALEFNVKTRSTVYSWLDKYFTKKKAYRDLIYQQLLASDSEARKASSTDTVSQEEDSGDTTATEAEGPVGYNEDTTSPIEATSCEEATEAKPKYDLIIDAHLPKIIKTAVIAYAKDNGLTYVSSIKSKYLTITAQALFLGKPAIVTSNIRIKKFAVRDNIPFIHTYSLDLKKYLEVHSEENLDAFARTESFHSFRQGANGNFYANKEELLVEFSLAHSFDSETVVEVLREGTEGKPDVIITADKISIKDGNFFKIGAHNPSTSMYYCWRFQLLDGVFYERGYKEGHIALKAKILAS